MTIPTIDLTTPTGPVAIPQVGYGTWRVRGEDVTRMLPRVFEAGYRHVDTAALYKNEAEVGTGIRESALAREDVFVTTKIWNDRHGYDETRRAFDESLERLGLEYVDLLLIHWPAPAQNRFVDAWQALRSIRDDGQVRVVGVSNFEPEHLQRLGDETSELPAINQVELHPYLQQRELREFHAQHGIVTEAWSPLGQGGDMLADPVVASIAAKHGVSPAQVVLGWNAGLGNVVLPRTVRPERLAENADLWSFALDAEDTAAIEALDRGARLGPDPRTFD